VVGGNYVRVLHVSWGGTGIKGDGEENCEGGARGVGRGGVHIRRWDCEDTPREFFVGNREG